MENKLKEHEVFLLAYKSLCRVLKNKKVYYKFRRFFGNGNEKHELKPTIYRAFPRSRNSNDKKPSDNPFMYSYSIDDAFETLKCMIGNDNIITEENCNDDSKVQFRVMQMINTIMHCCVELFISDYRSIEEIGKETFDMTCKKIYGDDFVDETEKQLPPNVKMLRQAQDEFAARNEMSLDPRIFMRDSRFIQYLKDSGILEHRHIHGLNERYEMPLRSYCPPTENDADRSWEDVLYQDFEIPF